jgi:hypothetical protein
MKSKDITNQVNEWTDPMDMINRRRMGPEMGGGGGAGGYIGGNRGVTPTGPGTTSSMTAQGARELAPQTLRTPAQVKTSKSKGPEEPIVKREAPPELTAQQRSYKELDRPAVQRKAETDKAAKDTAADKSSQPRYTMDPKTGKPIPANVQAQLQQKLQGKGFKEPEPGTISGFKPKGISGKTEKQARVEPTKAEPAKTEPAKVEPPKPEVRRTLGGDPIPAGYKYNPKTGKYDPPPKASIVKDILALPGGIKRALTPEPKNRKALAGSVGLHAALLAALANMSPDEKKAAAEKSKSAEQGDATTPMTVNLIDPGSTTASDAAATTTPATDQPKTEPSTMSATIDDGGEKSLPPVVVTAEPKNVPKKTQPVDKAEPTKKAEEPKADEVITTTEPSSWETEVSNEPERAEADKVDDKETSQTTPAVTTPAEEPESEDDILKRLLKLFDRPAEEPKLEPKSEPKAEKEPEDKKAEPKPKPETEPKDDKGKADAEKGDSDKKGDEKEAYPKFDRSEKNELPRDTEKKGSDIETRKTDSPVDKGPAAQGRDDAINYAPPPAERKYEPDDRATRLRDQLRQRSKRGASDADLENIPRMEPVRESLDHILGLSNITKKEIVESTMNIDMRQMLALLDEAAKMADIKGKKHTGKYGKEYDTDEEGDEKSKAKAEPAEKKGRGRPKKDSNVEAGKYKGADDAAKHIIGGKATSGKSKLPSKKHTLKDWVEYTEQTLVESEQIEEKAVSKAQQKFMGMVHAAQKGKKPASKEVAKVAKNMGKKDAKDFASTKHKGLPEKVKEEKFTSNGKPVSKQTYDSLMKAAGKQPSPDSVKEELKGGQVKLDKNKNGKLDSQDFKMMSKKKVKEGVNFAEMMKETQMTIEEMLEGLQQEIAEFKATGNMGEKLRDALDIHRHSSKAIMGETPMMAQPMVEEPVEESPFTYAARQAKASGEDSFKLGGETFPVKESAVEESGLQAYLGNKKYGKEGMDALRKAGREGASKEKMAMLRAKHDKMDEGSIEKSGPHDLTGTWSSDPPKKGQKDIAPPVPMDPVYPAEPPKQEKKPSSSKPMKESLEFSLWDSQLEKMLSESLTVTTTQGDNGQDDSVSITASGEKASEIMALLRNAGMGDMGGMNADVSPKVSEIEPEQMLSAYGVPMSDDSEGSSSGMDDMLALMQKLTGMNVGDEGVEDEVHVIDVDSEESDEQESDDYKDEEGSDDEGEEEDKSEEDSDEEDSDDEEEKVDEAYGQADEGNAFTGKLANTQQGGEFELDGKKYKDTSSLEEGEGMCQECGMYESECSHGRMDEADSPFQNENLESARPIEEELANGADDTTMQDIKYLIKTLAGGLNKEKRDQTTLPHTAVRMTEDVISDWKKLSGIK